MAFSKVSRIHRFTRCVCARTPKVFDAVPIREVMLVLLILFLHALHNMLYLLVFLLSILLLNTHLQEPIEITLKPNMSRNSMAFAMYSVFSEMRSSSRYRVDPGPVHDVLSNQ